jgi:peroxiredoxin Q/BCP
MMEPHAMPQPGDPAPDVQAAVTGGGTFSLEAARGSWVVLYFFPRAMTPG